MAVTVVVLPAVLVAVVAVAVEVEIEIEVVALAVVVIELEVNVGMELDKIAEQPNAIGNDLCITELKADLIWNLPPKILSKDFSCKILWAKEESFSGIIISPISSQIRWSHSDNLTCNITQLSNRCGGGEKSDMGGKWNKGIRDEGKGGKGKGGKVERKKRGKRENKEKREKRVIEQ